MKRPPKKPKRLTRTDLEYLNDQGWKSYEAELRMNQILERRLEAMQERLSKYEYTLEYQQ